MRTQLQLSRLLMALCLAAALPAPSSAQAKTTTRRVTLVENNKLPAGKQAMVIRRASGAERDFVELAPTATAADLNVALHVLEAVHQRFGETVTRDMAFAVAQAPAMPANRHAKVHGIFMQQLHSAKPRAVQGFGNVKSVEIRVPVRPKQAK